MISHLLLALVYRWILCIYEKIDGPLIPPISLCLMECAVRWQIIWSACMWTIQDLSEETLMASAVQWDVVTRIKYIWYMYILRLISWHVFNHMLKWDVWIGIKWYLGNHSLSWLSCQNTTAITDCFFWWIQRRTEVCFVSSSRMTWLQ